MYSYQQQQATNNTVNGSKRGFQIFDCRNEVGAAVPRTTGNVIIENNTFEGIIQWPDLMIGGTVSITGNNAIADSGAVAEVPLLVLRDTAASVVQNYSGNKVNGIEVTLDQKAFTHDSSSGGNLWVFYCKV